jgi:hypothetical protein
MITEDEVVEEKTAEVPQVRLSPEVICQGFSNELKKLTLLNKDSPRIFMVYAHSPYGKRGKEDHANSNIAKQIQGYLNPTNQAPCLSREGHLKLNLYSDLAPQGNGSEPHNQYKEADVLYSQMCLLPCMPIQR